MLSRIDTGNPSESSLLKRPLGQSHLQFFTVNDENYTTILAWIEAGAPYEAPDPIDDGGSGMITPTVVGDQSYFALQLYPKIAGTCSGCHNGGQRIDLNDVTPSVVCNNIKNFTNAFNAQNPTTSLMYAKPISAGVGHDGGKLWSANVEGALLVQWMSTNGKNGSCTMP